MFLYLLSFLLLFEIPVFSQRLNGLDREETQNLVEEIPAFDAEIDWTSGILRAKITIPSSQSEANIGRFYDRVQNEVNEALQSRLNKAIGVVRLSRDFKASDYYNAYPEIRYEVYSHLENARYYPVVKDGNSFKGMAELFLYGKDGILGIFFKNLQKRDVTNYIDEMKDLEYFDTLVIDMLLFKDFSPSVAPRIYDEDGLLLYGPETMDYESFLKNGGCLFTRSLSYAFSSQRTGKRVFYTMPKGITGMLNTDIVLFNSDAARLFASRRSIKYINQGNVIIVKP
ncbi:MAG: hypothetical protein ACP5QT_07020 [Brevinematia bacterium]